jgi:molybdopterin biosynthesis enzyme
VYCASLAGAQGSGILTSMVEANGFAIIPEDWSSAPANARVQVMFFD